MTCYLQHIAYKHITHELQLITYDKNAKDGFIKNLNQKQGLPCFLVLRCCMFQLLYKLYELSNFTNFT
ncbi:MAG: hypothetical protein UR99_C0043G0001, partial [Candidatus Moranbacteria bacterium GW2011_GWD2_36_12]